MKLSQKQIGHFVIFCVAVIFAVNIPITKYLLSGHISAYGITGLRCFFGAITFWIVSFFLHGKKVSKKDHLILFAGGISGIVLRQVLFVIGLTGATPIDAAIIVSATPLFAMIISAIFLKELITVKKISGIFIGILGAVVLVCAGNNGETAGKSDVVNDLFMMSSTLFYAIYLVITRPLVNKYSPITMMKWMFTYSALIFTPIFYKDIIDAPLFYEPNHIALITLIYPLLMATFLAYQLIPMAQKRISATTISMYNNLQPIIASFIAIIFQMDKLTFNKVFSVILVLGGVYLVTSGNKRINKNIID